MHKSITEADVGGEMYIAIPRDLLDPKNTVTVLLRESHRLFKPEILLENSLERDILVGRQ